MANFSIIIPTLGRSRSYEETEESLRQQSNQDFEIVKVTEEGSLAAIRNLGAKRAKGKYLVFIDDDVICSPGWLDAIHQGFRKGYAGVSGPSVIYREYRRQRDVFKYEWIACLFSSSRDVGKISRAGSWSRGASRDKCSFSGEVDYLEACNMAFEAKTFWEVGGFDEAYKGIGDWSEPDLCFRIRAINKKLWFSRNARLEHRPSQSGAYKKRLVKCDRMENYELFSKRWIKPSIRHSLYKLVLRSYFNLKERKWL